MKKIIQFRKAANVFFLAAVFLCAAIFGFLRIYGYVQRKQFEEIENGRRTALVQWQSQKIQTELAQLEGRMDAAAELIVESGLNPEGEWLEHYLGKLTLHESYKSYYDSITKMETASAAHSAPENADQNLRDLKEGRKITSDIRYSERLDGYYFAIAQPVVKDGVTIGSLRSVLPASVLILPEEDADDGLPVQFIVDSTGKVLYSTCLDEIPPEENLLARMEEGGFDRTGREKLQTVMQEAGSTTISAKIGEKKYMITAAYLGCNGWSLIQMADYGSMDDISRRLMLWTAVISLVLVVFALAASGTAFFIFMKQGERLRVEEQKTAELAAAFDTILFEYNARTGQVVLTPNAKEILALDSCRIKSRREWEALLHPDDYFIIEEGMQDVTGQFVREIRLRQKCGEWLWCECRMKPFGNGTGTGLYLGRISSIHERKMRELSLEAEKSTDPLTSLMNRTAFQARTEQLFEEDQAGFLFMLDIDNFKQINDSCGHFAGDQLLCTVAQGLRESFRDHDPVGRFGGDEFIMYMSDTDNLAYARGKAEFILERMEKLSGRQELPIHASIGIARYPQDSESYASLFRKADMAMYEAKKAGKNTYCFWCETENGKKA